LQKKGIDDEDDDVIANSNIQGVNIYQDNLKSASDQDELMKKKVCRAMHLLENSFNPEASTMLQNIEHGREIILEKANFALFIGILIDEEPSNVDEAWNHDDPKAGGSWQDSIKKEVSDMDKQQVWEIIFREEDIPENRRTIKCK
jgi:hypothetical protein